jgi:hypothetical protein
MNFAIDPDVLKVSFQDILCMAALNEISRDFKSHRFFRDKEGVLESEYRHIFIQKYETNHEHPTVVLLQRILSEDGNIEDTISSIHSIREKLERLGCSQPVEPELLGMVANARNDGLILAMVGYDADYLRKRGLHNETIRRLVRKEIPWLDIHWFGMPRIEIPESDYSDNNQPVIRAKQNAFEAKVALWLQDNDPCLRCTTPPHRGKVGTEQIDMYGYRHADDGITVVIGECKLRREGNETKSISVEEVQQLRRKVIAAMEYERSKRSSKGLTFEGILISNAQNVEEQAQQLVISETNFKIRVLRVTIQKGWESNEEWRIVGGEWQDFQAKTVAE